MILHPALARLRFERDVQPLIDAPQVFASVGRRVLRCAYPVLEMELAWQAGGSALILHIQADDYDYRPARGWWVDADGHPLLGGSGRIPVNHGFHRDPNPYNESCAWFCFRGWREYHDHASHQEVSWAALRAEERYRLPGLIAQLHSDLNHLDPNKRPVAQ